MISSIIGLSQDYLDALKQHHGDEAVTAGRNALNVLIEYNGSAHNRGLLAQSVEHHLRVAQILLGLGLDIDCVLTGLLHDFFVISPQSEQPGRDKKSRESLRDDEKIRRSQKLKSLFGDSVHALVEDTSRLVFLKAKTKTAQSAETIRKMLFAMARDIRVIIVSLADRLDSLRQRESLDEETKKDLAKDCMDIYAPLADRLGMNWIKDELEDGSLEVLNKEAFEQIQGLVNANQEEQLKFLSTIEGAIRAAAGEEKITVEVTSRAKHYYSIYHKMRKRAKDSSEILDLLGLRLICQSSGDCYQLLGLVHRLWPPIEGRFKDYISMPKANGYQSLHTTVMCPGAKAVEVQIRTEEMHRIAEHGVASHWLYKSDPGQAATLSKSIPLMNRLREWSEFAKNKDAYLEEIRKELLKDSIFVFTPQGDVIQLPAGATALDFAFAVHSDVGIHCQGAKANGHIVSFDTELHNTQVIEIITSVNAHPTINWLSCARTSKARAKIRSWLLQSGEALLFDSNIVVAKKPVPKQEHPKTIDKSKEDVQREHHPSMGHLLDSSGKAFEYHAVDAKNGIGSERLGIAIDGIRNLMVRIAGCCHPVTGDQIIGYISRGRGIVVHRTNCTALRSIPDFVERRIEVQWEHSANMYTARFRIVSQKSLEIFSEIENAAHKFKGKLKEGRLYETGDGKYTGVFTMEVATREDSKKIVKSLRSLPSISLIEEE